MSEAFWRSAATFRGWGFGPYRAAGRTVECCVFAAEVLAGAYGLGAESLPGSRWWFDLMLEERDPWSAVTAAASRPGGRVLPADKAWTPQPGRWHLCQGWSSRGEHHVWLWYADPHRPGYGVALESAGRGPRVWDAQGKRPLDEVLTAGGALRSELVPLDWSRRAAPWTVAACVLPEVASG